jgi:DNA-directed RNA polymerase subunit beta'
MKTAGFLDNMKDMGYKFAFKGGLSFSLRTLEFRSKPQLIADAEHKLRYFCKL